jgi:multisubunit Na+/H+ antiporter MnhE subunit
MIRTRIYFFFILLGAWLCLTSSLHAHELAAGAVLSLVLSILLGRGYEALGFPPFGIKRAWYFLLYLIALAISQFRCCVQDSASPDAHTAGYRCGQNEP